jgi:sulfur carrier protein
MSMRVLVNGEPRELSAGTTVAAVVRSLPGTQIVPSVSGTPEGRGLAVAVDGEVVPRGSWSATELGDGARVEIVVAVQGG